MVLQCAPVTCKVCQTVAECSKCTLSPISHAESYIIILDNYQGVDGRRRREKMHTSGFPLSPVKSNITPCPTGWNTIPAWVESAPELRRVMSSYW